MMIDVVEALHSLEKCAHEMDAELSQGRQVTPFNPSNLAVRALAERGLRLADLSVTPRVKAADIGLSARVEPDLTLGALIAFRAAARFARAGASPTYTVNASYRAVMRYIEILPIALRDAADIHALQNGSRGANDRKRSRTRPVDGPDTDAMP
jgi:hypothetical protein